MIENQFDKQLSEQRKMFEKGLNLLCLEKGVEVTIVSTYYEIKVYDIFSDEVIATIQFKRSNPGNHMITFIDDKTQFYNISEAFSVIKQRYINNCEKFGLTFSVKD